MIAILDVIEIDSMVMVYTNPELNNLRICVKNGIPISKG